MIELLLFASEGVAGAEPSWVQQILFFIGAWLTGMGMIISSLVIVVFIVFIAISMSYD